MESGIPVYLDTPRGTLGFNVGTLAPGTPIFRLDGDQGFALSSDLRVSEDDFPVRDGTLVSDAYAKGLHATLKGTIRASSNADRATALDMIRSYARSIMRADGTLRWTPTGKAERRATVRCLLDPLDGGAVVKSFQIGLTSESAVSIASAVQSVDTSGLSSVIGGGINFPAGFPLDFGDAGSSGGTANVTNGGDADASAVVTIHGAISAPVLRNTTTGQYVSLPGLTINPGDTVVIDMDAETVLYNGSPTFSLFSFVDVLNSSFWKLAPGVNAISLSGASPDVNAKATIVFHDTFA